MNNSPGWASPGSARPDDQGSGRPGADTPDSGGTDSGGTDSGGTGRDSAGVGAGDRSRPAPEEHGAPPPNWSKDQPPGGQWAAPTGHGQGRPPGGWSPGPGGQGGWGYGWAQPPTAAKPGVIPLRPLGVGEILDGAVSAMRAHWRTVLGISLAVAVITQTVSTLVSGLWFNDSAGMRALENDPEPTVGETLDTVGGTLAGSGVAALVGMLGTLVATAMLTVVVSRAVLGREVSTGDAWRSSRPQLLRLLGLLLIIPMLILAVTVVALAPGLVVTVAGPPVLGGVLTLAGGLAAAVAAVWLWIRYSLAAPALMLEGQGVTTSMRRSAKLVRGAWWRIFGIQLLTVVLLLFVSAVIEIPTSIVALVVGGDGAADWLTGSSADTGWAFLVILGIGAVISSTITFPISAGVTALLYIDQRIRREALDLELGRAAGVPGYGTPQPAGERPGGTTPGS